MTTTLKDLLAEYAEDAKAYDVRAQALRTGRRRRRIRRATPAALVLLAVATIGLTQLPEPPQSTGPSLPSSRSDLPGYPAAVDSEPNPAPLPTDRAVGSALMVYNHPDGGHRLVLRDGTQYRLDSPSHGPETTDSYLLSPSGRWLAWPTYADGEPTIRLRDLSGTAMIDFLGTGLPTAWSNNDRWLVLSAPIPRLVELRRQPVVIALIDLAATPPSSTDVDLGMCTECGVAAVRSDGSLVLEALGMGNLGSLIIMNPLRGGMDKADPVNIDLSGHAAADELAATSRMADDQILGGVPNRLRLMNDDTALMPVVRREGDHAVGSSSLDILVLRLDQHVVQQRWQLPEPRAIEGDTLGLWERWDLLAVLPEGLLLAHSTNQRLLSWEIYSPSTRALSLVTDLRGLSSDRQ
jgi:hypothetical protein